MNLNCILVSAVLAATLGAIATSASAAIAVDISGASNVGETVSLTKGVYNIAFVDNTANNGFNGFSFWSSTSGCGTPDTCQQGFTELYEVTDGAATTQYIQRDAGAPNGYNIHDTAADALAGYQAGGVYKIVNGVNEGISTLLTISSTSDAHFYIDDSYYPDNRGGVSLSLSAVPEPATWAMMLVGFGGLGLAMRTARRPQTATV